LCHCRLETQLELHLELALEELDNTWREILRVQRNTSIQLLTNDVIYEENYQRITTQIDNALTKEQIVWQKVSDVESELRTTIEIPLSDNNLSHHNPHLVRLIIIHQSKLIVGQRISIQ